MMSILKIAIQKSGRLHDQSLKLLRDCGIYIDNGSEQLKASAANFPIEVLYLRNSDIPQYLEDGVVDLAIIGENTLIEKQKDVEVLQKLGFSKCRLSLAVPKNQEDISIEWFLGKKIATSYPNSLVAFLKENNLEAEIHQISGSVEIAPNIGLADAICDLVSSGSTLFKNGLKEVSTILKSEACLASNKNLSIEKKEIAEKLIFRINAVIRAEKSKYVLMNVPNNKIDEVSALLPVLKSPTVLPLALEGWSSLHTVIDEEEFWEVIDQLKK
ncbi:MAG: ATP phosphoribosyltransferase, partial [Cyclobacteriaceae bacterium]|nr:ATP phosphoribosyltransferase [Cyclobacteriaceae bacterium]